MTESVPLFYTLMFISFKKIDLQIEQFETIYIISG